MKGIYFVLCLLFINLLGKSQGVKSNQDLLFSKKIENTRFNKHTVVFGFQNNNKWIKYNPISILLSSAMFGYQKVISPQISADCMFQPSCSGYSKELIHHLGLVKGTLATLDRLFRCNRIAATDVWPTEYDQHDHKVHETYEIYK